MVDAQTGPGSLDAFFSPRSIAVLGASPGKSDFPNLVLHNLAAHGYPGTVTAVHPQHTSIDGVPAVPSLRALTPPPDLCVIGVRAERVAALLRECVEIGVPAVTILASRFAELGTEEGIAMQRELGEIIAGSKTRVMGPNCLGMGNFANHAVSLASGNIPAQVPAGPVAIVSQSGGLALLLMLRGIAQGMGLGQFVNVGNEMDVSIPELLEAMAARDDVRVVICYLEGTRDAQALRRGLEACGRAGKPVILLRGGLTKQGRAAAASHTGSLAGDGAIWRGFVKQVGAVEAESIDHALAAARLFERFGLAPGQRRIGGFAGGGGLTVMFSDMLDRAGISTPPFTPETQERIRTALPDVTPNNPMDMGGMFLAGDGSKLTDALDAMASDPNVDALALCMSAYLGNRDRVINGAVLRATGKLAKPAIFVSYAVPGAESVIRDAGCFVLEPPEPGVQGLRSWLGYHGLREAAAQAATAGGIGGVPDARAGSAAAQGRTEKLQSALSQGDKVILEDAGKDLLRLYGVACPDEQIVADEDAAVAAARRIGQPVALKLLSSTMLHRGIGRGVIINLRDEAQVREAFRTIAANANGHADARFLVQQMVKPNLELLVGATRDPEMGLAMAIGMGGANVEAAKEVVFCLPPVTPDAVRALLDAWPALADAQKRRGAIDKQALVAAIAGISAMLVDGEEWIEELDVNPLIVGAPGEGAVAVDALFVLRGGD